MSRGVHLEVQCLRQDLAVCFSVAGGPMHTPESTQSPEHNSVHRRTATGSLRNAASQLTCMSSLVSEADSASLVKISLNMGGLSGSCSARHT